MAGWDRADTRADMRADGGAGAGTDIASRFRAGELTPRRIAANVASIEGVPEELLGGVDREWAFVWARKGYDVYACRDEEGVWYLWLATRCLELGKARPGSGPLRALPQRH